MNLLTTVFKIILVCCILNNFIVKLTTYFKKIETKSKSELKNCP